MIDDKGGGEGETIIGVHGSGITLQEGANTSISRFYCSNCKKKIHCFVKIDKETKKAIVHKTCRDTACKCKCKTHYACKQCGFLHPYGQNKCDRIELTKQADNLKADIEFDKIMQEYQELKPINQEQGQIKK